MLAPRNNLTQQEYTPFDRYLLLWYMKTSVSMILYIYNAYGGGFVNNISWDEVPEFSSDYDTYKNPIEGKTYISPSLENKPGPSQDTAQTIRLVTRGIDQELSYEMVKEKDH